MRTGGRVVDAFLLFPLNSRQDCKGVGEGAVDMAGASLERQDIPAPALKSAAEPEGPSSSFPNAWELGSFLPLTCLGSVYRTPAAPQKHALFLCWEAVIITYASRWRPARSPRGGILEAFLL